ncbi:MAG: protein ImuB [Planctomycetota bacterium]|jgi:protein ImuB
MILKSSLSYSLWDSSTGEKALQLQAEAGHKQLELWLAIHLPSLALEIVSSESHSRPLVIIEEINNKQFVHMPSHAAELLGIVSGMTLGAAYTLCADLQIELIKPLAQQKRLQELASWAQQFSPRISLQAPCSLLIEVRGSIKYFGKLDTIQNQISDALENKWKHHYYLAVSPSPLASLLLAKSANQIVVNDITGLRSALGGLSIALLPLSEKRKQQLVKTGVRVLRDLWRLPSASLARRFGKDLVNYLDRTLGKIPSPLTIYQPPARFDATYDISYEVNNYQLLLPYAYKLLDDLCDFLRKSDVYASNFIFYFQHQQHIPTIIDIDLRQPLRDARHFMMLLETKLSQKTLATPVFAIKLVAETLHAYTTQTLDLFSSQGASGVADENIEYLLEQLYARLGYDLIKGIVCHEDHRPEYASQNSTLEIRPYKQIKKPRPFWLLAEPKQLRKKNNRLYYKSIIHFCMGPERIESGWWDDADIQRDYYIGIDELVGSLWIYQDLKDKKFWYLHGLFG